jgi:glycolate oxidase FAD binding subunit
MMLRPRSIDELCQAVAQAPGPVLAVAGGTKPAASRREGAQPISLADLRGMVEYEPSEYTFTALAGTPLAEISAQLARHGQYLPFDPFLTGSGATLGGTVAAAASGPGRLRYGGVRDFIIGVRFVDGAGRLLRGGGKVVKNAAGFDFPKLLCGSLGRLGILAELSFKVFPAPQARRTAEISCPRVEDALERIAFIAAQPWEAEALEWLPQGRLLLRIMGEPAALDARMEKILRAVQRPAVVLADADAQALWAGLGEFSWAPSGHQLVRISLSGAAIPRLLTDLGGCPFVLSQAANFQFAAWPGSLASLDSILTSHGQQAVVWRGEPGRVRLGAASARSVEAMVKQSLDPDGKFPPWPEP